MLTIKSLSDYNHDFCVDHADTVECVRENYLIQWSGWIASQGSLRLVGHWTAYPVKPQLPEPPEGPYRPYLAVMAGAMGEGWCLPGGRFDLRPHPERGIVHREDLHDEAGIAKVEAECERARARLHELIDGLLSPRQWAPMMRQVVPVFVDIDTGCLLTDVETGRTL